MLLLQCSHYTTLQTSKTAFNRPTNQMTGVASPAESMYKGIKHPLHHRRAEEMSLFVSSISSTTTSTTSFSLFFFLSLHALFFTLFLLADKFVIDIFNVCTLRKNCLYFFSSNYYSTLGTKIDFQKGGFFVTR